MSTVFLGLDHSFSFRASAPVLWETMIFRVVDHPMKPGLRWTTFEDFQERYTSHAQAIAGHTRAVDMVLARSKPS